MASHILLEPSLIHDRMVLSHVRGGAHSASLSDAPAPDSAAAMMLQQVTNTGAEPY